MATFNPYTDFKYDPGSFSSGSFGSGSLGSFPSSSFYQYQPNPNLYKTPIGNFNSFFQPGSGSSDSTDKKKASFEDFAKFAGQRLEAYSQNRNMQGGSSPFNAAGAGGVSQSGDLTIVYPQPKQVIPAQGGGLGGTIGSIAGAALGSLIAPGIGTSIGGQLGGAVGGFF